ncbi:MAG TPA: exodeoxyribonuclease III [Verrucomicrobiales bacterium]|nr:exodeoxyribonuclease III [Verrucomicrobiales bacterium]HIL25500.1 exodeoxyribonuclease III [Verrucomicrobiota bacterium]
MKILSWNVNGLRAVQKKGFADWLKKARPDILCVQESRALPEQVEPDWPKAYEAHWNPAEKKGYSGVMTFTKTPPIKVTRGIGIAEHDHEGRVLTTEHDDFFLVNVYVPNAQRSLARLPYRQQWDRDFLAYLKKLERRKPIIFCGDLNVSHKEIDLKNFKANKKNAGFTAEERAGFDAFVAAGFIDTFREFETGSGHYTWWSNRLNARARNIGWRIDYFLISKSLRPRLKKAFILPAVMGSDHCPVGIEIG